MANNKQLFKAIGSLVGGAVGDALGAPFEFRPAGEYSKQFPQSVVGGCGEMVGGGSFGWEPGEFTDDTQMALALAESLVSQNGYDPDDVWHRFVTWSKTAADVGSITRMSLNHGTRLGAAEVAHKAMGRSAGNGALMRVFPMALAFLDAGTEHAMAVVFALQ